MCIRSQTQGHRLYWLGKSLQWWQTGLSAHQHNHISYIHYWGRAVKLVILCPNLDIVTMVTWALYVKKPLPDHSDVTSNGSNAPKSISSGATPYVGRNPLQSWQP